MTESETVPCETLAAETVPGDNSEENEREHLEIGGPAEGGPQPSKRSIKKALANERREANREEWKKGMKEKDRARRRARKAEKAKRREIEGDGPPQEPSPVRVVIDCDFDSLMTDKELASMTKQLAFCYSKNRVARHPMQLAVANYGEQMTAQMNKKQQFWPSWKMTFDERSYLDLYPDSKDRLVYLSADSPNVIDNIEDDKIYIIGGIVDKNRHKLLCYNRAEQQGIAHGRLKIDTYIRMKGRPILTVDQVLEIISKYLECRDWEAAFFAVIPKRKELTSKKELAPKDSSKGDEGESDGSSDSDAEEVRGTLRGQSAGTYTG